MRKSSAPYSVPRNLEPDLARVRAYWEGLKRGKNEIPFLDDLAITSLPDLSERLVLIDIFGKPERYRLAMVGRQITERYGSEIAGRFADEIAPQNPFEYLRSQCSAAIERGAPAWYRHASASDPNSHASQSYARMLFPMWGEGRIGALLGAFVWL